MPPRAVLVVDDEEDIRESLRVFLEQREPGLVVKVAPDGPSALAILAEAPVGVVVADYRMPGMDGIEFLRRAARVVPAAARVLITAYPDMGVAVRALDEVRVDHFLTKPVAGREFHALVRALLDRGATGPAAGAAPGAK